jgi:hypothetical protein
MNLFWTIRAFVTVRQLFESSRRFKILPFCHEPRRGVGGACNGNPPRQAKINSVARRRASCIPYGVASLGALLISAV